MQEMIKVNIDTQTVSARDLHEQLNIRTKFTTWFERMCEYGFAEGIEFFPKMGETSEQGGRPATDYNISIDMAKQICMIQRTPEGKQCRQYLIDMEKAWNTPEQVMARALRMADATIEKLKNDCAGLIADNQRMKPKEIFADAVSASSTSILVRDLAKILKQNGINIGERRLYQWMRNNGYIVKNGITPTQRAMELCLYEVIERTIERGDSKPIVKLTTKVTGKGQQYFINKFLNGEYNEAI